MLDQLFYPEKVAVIGASRSEGKTGHEIFDNLLHDFEGEVVPVNPNANKIHGQNCFDEVPEETDMAVIAVPAKLVPEVIRSCGEKGVEAAIVVSAGFSESGQEELEEKVRKMAESRDIDLLGPNVLGLINSENKMNASFASKMPQQGDISFMSQSGAFCTAILDYAKAENIGFRHFVSLGNKASIDEIDLLERWKNDETETVLGYTEGIEDGRDFIDVARDTSQEKPIVMVKSGRTENGSKAASSHTGSIAGSYQAYEAAFRKSGVIEAESNRELLDFGRAFAYQPLPEGKNIAIVTNAGGPGVIASDEIEENGLEMAEFRDSTVRKLEKDLPDESSAENPVDVIGDAGHERYKKALNAVIQDEDVDGVLVILTPQANTEIDKTAKSIVKVQSDYDKPLMATFIGEDQVESGMNILEKNRVPDFQDPKDAVKALRAMYEYSEFLDREETFEEIEYDRTDAEDAFSNIESFDGKRKLLESYGFEFPLSRLCGTPAKAEEAAVDIGYPVVVKLDSPEIDHKTELDGVKTGLKTRKEVQNAFSSVTEAVYHSTSGSGAEINGVVVQEHLDGLEVAIGMKRDPQFGPMVMVGLGGIYIEALEDVAFGIAPVSHEEAERMINELESHELFEGTRGKEVAKQELKQSIIRMGQIGLNHDEVNSIDVNPLILTSDEALVADVEVELE